MTKRAGKPPVFNPSPSGFCANHGPKMLEGLSKEHRLRFILLGSLEALPFFASLGFGSLTEPAIPAEIVWLTGIVLSVAAIWLLRHKTPLTVIHFAENSDPKASHPDASHTERPVQLFNNSTF